MKKLPQHYSDLWDLFKEIKNSRDEEAYEVLLADAALREDFYRRLAEYAKTFGIALSTEAFVMGIDEEKLRRYEADLKRFQNLKALREAPATLKPSITGTTSRRSRNCSIRTSGQRSHPVE